jgi:GNAT superfamily N-acetyltransferase
VTGTEVIRDRDPDATGRILRALPSWFGIESAIDHYIAATADPEFDSWVAREGAAVIGVALVRRHFQESAELALLAVAPEWHGSGVGRRLVQAVVDALVSDDCQVLCVHTVGPSFVDEGYARTRAFYRAVGFIPIQEFTGIDWDGPTLVLVKPLVRA